MPNPGNRRPDLSRAEREALRSRIRPEWRWIVDDHTKVQDAIIALLAAMTEVMEIVDAPRGAD